jgi:hypothetical protein
MGRDEDIYQALTDGGMAALQRLVDDHESENLWLDFKCTTYDGTSSSLPESDRRNLAKAISGFGNSAGGVIVWGVDCRRKGSSGDIAKGLSPIPNVAGFKSLLNGFVSACTYPPHPTVVTEAVASADALGAGYAITYIPKHYIAPLKCLQGKQEIYQRAGSSHQPVSYDTLSWMFGRRPPVALKYEWTLSGLKVSGHENSPYVSFTADLGVQNLSQRLIRGLYGSIKWDWPDDNGEISCDIKPEFWHRQVLAAHYAGFHMHHDAALLPQTPLPVLRLRVTIHSRFTQGLRIDLMLGREDGDPTTYRISVAGSPNLERLWRELTGGARYFERSNEDTQLQMIRDTFTLCNFETTGLG